jgi:hypothetical protein
VVLGVVDGVDTDSVETELLELGNIALAALAVSDGVLGVSSTAGLVVNAADVEALVASEESCGELVLLDATLGDQYEPFPFTVTGVMPEARLAGASVAGVAAAPAASTAAARENFMMMDGICDLVSYGKRVEKRAVRWRATVDTKKQARARTNECKEGVLDAVTTASKEASWGRARRWRGETRNEMGGRAL